MASQNALLPYYFYCCSPRWKACTKTILTSLLNHRPLPSKTFDTKALQSHHSRQFQNMDMWREVSQQRCFHGVRAAPLWLARPSKRVASNKYAVETRRLEFLPQRPRKPCGRWPKMLRWNLEFTITELINDILETDINVQCHVNTNRCAFLSNENLICSMIRNNNDRSDSIKRGFKSSGTFYPLRKRRTPWT
jgi:hypothetical protein